MGVNLNLQWELGRKGEEAQESGFGAAMMSLCRSDKEAQVGQVLQGTWGLQ
jgi:hypothetical protein